MLSLARIAAAFAASGDARARSAEQQARRPARSENAGSLPRLRAVHGHVRGAATGRGVFRDSDLLTPIV
eukprot:3607720-Rhodomonas_salina.3